MISWLDIAVVAARARLGRARPPVRAPPARVRQRRVRARRARGRDGASPRPPARAADHPDPLFAYYYIWFNGTSWDRAKTDYPVLGRYSSDDRGVMRQHIAWAKRAGIDGFIVSWKSTPVLNRRLERLADVAAAEHFKLARDLPGARLLPRAAAGGARRARPRLVPAPPRRPARAFRAFRKPLVIWSGTWRFSRREVASVTRSRRDGLLILASERNVGGLPAARRTSWTATRTTGRRSTRAPIPTRPAKLRALGRDGARPAAASGSPRRRRDSTPGSWAARASCRAAVAPRCARSSTPPRARIRTRSG